MTEALYTFSQRIGKAQAATYFCGKMDGVACVLYDITHVGNVHGTHYVSVIHKAADEFKLTDLPIASEEAAREQFRAVEAKLRAAS